MAAVDKMMAALVGALGLDVEAVKKEVTSRIASFEGNVHTLNSTLISILQTQHRIEHNLKVLMRERGMEYEEAPPPPAPRVIEGNGAAPNA